MMWRYCFDRVALITGRAAPLSAISELEGRKSRQATRPATCSISRDWERMVRDLLANEPLDARTCRYARSGILLARHRYADPRQWWTLTKALYGALFVNPDAVTHAGFPKKELLPGREPIWQLFAGQTYSWFEAKRHVIFVRLL